MDKLAELEKVILDYYLARGYKIGTGDWSFEVEIATKWKFKHITVFFWDNVEVFTPYCSISATTGDMFAKAIKFFKQKRIQNEHFRTRL